MAFRSIEEFERILKETPPAARYIDLSWSTAKHWDDWHEIRIRMISAANAVHPYSKDDADDYRTLAEIAKDHRDRAQARKWAELMVGDAPAQAQKVWVNSELIYDATPAKGATA